MLIIGAKGFAKEIVDVIEQNKVPGNLTFFDEFSDSAQGKFLDVFSVINSEEEAIAYLKADNEFLIAVGNPEARKKICARFERLGGKLVSLVSPLARVGNHNVQLENGVMLSTFCIVENNVKIGKGSFLNFRSSVAHDSVVGGFTEISPGAIILGGCEIGDGCSIGAGAIILPRVKIGNNVVIGAGAVVISNVEEGRTMVGVPAKPIK
jgi:sugar O-acyltransferase (sialic acid O-acetyltransferase NeuD family)